MKFFTNQRGSSHVVLVLAVVVIAAVGIIGYRVTQNQDPAAVSTSTTPATTSEDSGAINSKADLKDAEASLDNTAIDSSVNPDQLDDDINALL